MEKLYTEENRQNAFYLPTSKNAFMNVRPHLLSLTESRIVELRAYDHPPKAADMIAEGVSILFGQKKNHKAHLKQSQANQVF